MLCKVYNHTSFHQQVMKEKLQKVQTLLTERDKIAEIIPDKYAK